MDGDAKLPREDAGAALFELETVCTPTGVLAY